MPLINLVIVLLLVGVLLWVINAYLTMDKKIKNPEYRRRRYCRAVVSAGLRRVGIARQHTHRPLILGKQYGPGRTGAGVSQHAH